MWPTPTRRWENIAGTRSSSPLRRCVSSCSWFWFDVGGVLSVYLLTPPPSYLCCSVLCVWGGAGGAGHVRRSVNTPSPSLHVSFGWSLLVKRCVERLFLAPPRCDHRWMGVLPSSSRWWHHQSGAARILPGQFPGNVTHTDSGVELSLQVLWNICQKEQLFYLFSIQSFQWITFWPFTF